MVPLGKWRSENCRGGEVLSLLMLFVQKSERKFEVVQE